VILTLVDVLSIVGGLFSSLSAIGTAVCASICYNLMMSSLISHLYHFKVGHQKEALKFPPDNSDDDKKKKEDYYGND
jgi:hypothetical protein